MMYSCVANTTFKDHQSDFLEDFENLCNFSLKMCKFYDNYLFL